MATWLVTLTNGNQVFVEAVELEYDEVGVTLSDGNFEDPITEAWFPIGSLVSIVKQRPATGLAPS